MDKNKLTKFECEEIIKIIMDSKVYTNIKGVIMEKLHQQIHKERKILQVRGYKDFIFHGIECMISDDRKELGFFKDSNDVRPSSATYILFDKAEHLYNVFYNTNK